MKRLLWNKMLQKLFWIAPLILFVSCSKEDPKPQFDTETITEVTLLFSPFGSGVPVTFTATDPDGDGDQPLQVDGPIVLSANTTYDLFIQLENAITNEDIADEVEAEGVDHMFFFAFTEGLFITPQGKGNIEERIPGAVIYGDTDSMGQPLGLITTWANGAPAKGTFRVVLSHQPDELKTDESTAAVGGKDFDLTWEITLE